MESTATKPEPCEICGKPIVWTASREAKNANKPNGPTHCCPASAYDAWRKGR